MHLVLLVLRPLPVPLLLGLLLLLWLKVVVVSLPGLPVDPTLSLLPVFSMFQALLVLLLLPAVLLFFLVPSRLPVLPPLRLLLLLLHRSRAEADKTRRSTYYLLNNVFLYYLSCDHLNKRAGDECKSGGIRGRLSPPRFSKTRHPTHHLQENVNCITWLVIIGGSTSYGGET